MAVTVGLSGAATPILDRVDGTITPQGALPASVAPSGAAVPTTQFLDRPGGRLAYDDTAGAGPLVICLPSLGDLRQEYRFLAPQLVVAGYRVVTMDLRGHGESSVGWDDYSAAAVGSDIVALVRELESGPAIVVGTSMSAGAAVWAAADAPDLIAGQVLIGPFVRSATVGSKPSKMQDLLIKALFAGPWAAPGLGALLSDALPRQPPRRSGDLSRRAEGEPARAGADGRPARDDRHEER